MFFITGMTLLFFLQSPLFLLLAVSNKAFFSLSHKHTLAGALAVLIP